MKAAGYLLLPVVRPALLHNQVNRFRFFPFFQNVLSLQEKIGRNRANWRFFPGVLINKKEFSVEIKNQAAAVVQWTFEDRLAGCLQPWIEIPLHVCEREIWSCSCYPDNHTLRCTNLRTCKCICSAT